MTGYTLDELPPEASAVHLLGISDTKIGKSTYAATAAKQGMRVVYVDSDNGESALRYALAGNAEAMRRVHLWKTAKPAQFVVDLLRSTTVRKFMWNLTSDSMFSPHQRNVDPSDDILIADITAIPPSVLLTIDSWTSFSGDAMGMGAKAKGVDILNMENSMQGVYGDATARATLVSNLLQKLPCHVFVQAHGTIYERYEKPTGKEQREIKQGEMILRETIAIPVSTSRPHGLTMGSRFNHIGWFSVNRMGETLVDFTRLPDRVGGGPPNKIAKVSELPFVKLVDPSGTNPPVDPGQAGMDQWSRIVKAGEIMAASASANANANATAAQKPATAAGVNQSPSKAPAPTGNPLRPAGNLGGLNLKR